MNFSKIFFVNRAPGR